MLLRYSLELPAEAQVVEKAVAEPSRRASGPRISPPDALPAPREAGDDVVKQILQ